MTTCQSCEPGWTSAFPNERCTMCLAGTVCGYERLLPSPSFIVSWLGFHRVAPCAQCTKCTPGTFQNIQGQKTCLTCPGGSYSEFGGATVCSSCGSGWYLDHEGGTSPHQCQLCPAGNYCPYDKTGAPLQCPATGYCPAGSTAPIYCSALFHPDPVLMTCQASAGLYVLSVMASVVLIAIVGLVVYHTRRSSTEEEAREEASKLLKNENAGPVYQGL